MEWIWINGQLMPLEKAVIAVEDRGFQFADGVYEVVRLYDGRPVWLEQHLDRLERSCRGIAMTPPGRETLIEAARQVLSRWRPRDGMLYLQATRGSARRNHLFPPAGPESGTTLCYARAIEPPPTVGAGEGQRLVSVADERWRRCWVKSIALLPNVLARNQAAEAAGALGEAVFVEGGQVSECSSSNLFAVIDGAVVTAPVGAKVLAGITRSAALESAVELGLATIERPMTLDEARGAREVFITSTIRELAWVAEWDGQPIARACGDVTRALHERFKARVDSYVATV